MELPTHGNKEIMDKLNILGRTSMNWYEEGIKDEAARIRKELLEKDIGPDSDSGEYCHCYRTYREIIDEIFPV